MKPNLAFKLINNPFWDHKAKTDAIGVECLIILDKTKESEKFVLVLFFNADAGVDYRDLKVFFIWFLYNAYLDFNFAGLGEF